MLSSPPQVSVVHTSWLHSYLGLLTSCELVSSLLYISV